MNKNTFVNKQLDFFSTKSITDTSKKVQRCMKYSKKENIKFYT